MRVGIIDYHKGNLKSVQRAFEAAGVEAPVSDDIAALRACDALVLPGVGAFADASASMLELGLMDPVREAAASGVPFLGICLGQHLMYEEGEEGEVLTSEDEEPLRPKGLGLLPGVVTRMPALDSAGVVYKIPHVGWNALEVPAEGDYVGDGSFASPLLEGITPGEFVYFTHSYCAPRTPADIAWTTHSLAFPSAVQFRDCAFGVQFHPEKSSDVGARIVRNFINIVKES